MRPSLFLGVAAALAGLLSACHRPLPGPRTIPQAPQPGLTLTVRFASGEVRTLAIEDYVRASILSELSPPWSDSAAAARMFQVQAVLARTFALASRGRHHRDGFDLCDTTHCQLVDLDRSVHSRWREVALAAVRLTAGQTLQSDGQPALALFHADCGGYRSAAGDVWGGRDRRYLAAGIDPLPGGARHLEWRLSIDKERLREVLERDPLTSPGRRLDRIEVFRRDSAGRAALVFIAGERAPLVRGEEFRAALARALGAGALKSTRFDVRDEEGRIEFVGQGYGHGVGLCQRGAMARALAGADVEEIFEFYFPGTILTSSHTQRY